MNSFHIEWELGVKCSKGNTSGQFCCCSIIWRFCAVCMFSFFAINRDGGNMSVDNVALKSVKILSTLQVKLAWKVTSKGRTFKHLWANHLWEPSLDCVFSVLHWGRWLICYLWCLMFLFPNTCMNLPLKHKWEMMHHLTAAAASLWMLTCLLLTLSSVLYFCFVFSII